MAEEGIPEKGRGATGDPDEAVEKVLRYKASLIRSNAHYRAHIRQMLLEMCITDDLEACKLGAVDAMTFDVANALSFTRWRRGVPSHWASYLKRKEVVWRAWNMRGIASVDEAVQKVMARSAELLLDDLEYEKHVEGLIESLGIRGGAAGECVRGGGDRRDDTRHGARARPRRQDLDASGEAGGAGPQDMEGNLGAAERERAGGRDHRG